MQSFVQFILAIGGVQGLILFVLLCFDKKSSTASVILGTLCLFLSINFLVPLVIMTGDTKPWLYLVQGWVLFLPASYGALNFLYYRSALSNKGLSKLDAIHLLPILCCYLINITWLIDPSATGLQLYFSGAHPPGLALNFSILILYVQAFAYNLISIVYVYRYQRLAQQNLSDFNPDIFLWLWTFLGFTLVIWSLKVQKIQ